MSRNIALDILKLTMAFMVIGVHAEFLKGITSLGHYITVNGLFRIAVPIFLIINGFYFYPVLNKSKHITWLKKISILYIVWMLFYSYFWFSVPDLSLYGFVNIAQDIIIGYHHLWYISGMIGAALVLLALHRLPAWLLAVSVILTFLTGVFIQYLGNYNTLEGTYLNKLFNYHWVHRNMLLFSYPFFCIGFLVHKYSLQNTVSMKQAVSWSVFGLLLLLAESSFNFYSESSSGGFDNFLSLLLVCPCIFIVFMKSSIAGQSKNIALYSSAIYFIHSFLLSVFRRFIELDPTILTLVVVIASMVCAFFIININKKLTFIL